GEPEPRFQVNVFQAESPPLFGVDANGLAPDQPVVIDGSTLGYPVASVSQLPAGEYFAQAVLNVYTTFHRSDGYVVTMHMDQGEGQHWQTSPGNLVSAVQKVTIDPASNTAIRIAFTQKIPPIDPPKDTRFVKHMRIRSDAVSKFWGHEMDVGAAILLPDGFD